MWKWLALKPLSRFSRFKVVFCVVGFDHDPEAQHVREITEKLANFVIETDTDTTSMPTDTGTIVNRSIYWCC